MLVQYPSTNVNNKYIKGIDRYVVYIKLVMNHLHISSLIGVKLPDMEYNTLPLNHQHGSRSDGFGLI